MFVSFHGYNELHIENIMTLALDEVRKVIWPQWPDGIESDVVLDYKCVVKFRNTPWDLSGSNVRQWVLLIVDNGTNHSLSVISQKCLQADRLVLSIIPETSEFSWSYIPFWLICEHQGYSFQTAVNIATPVCYKSLIVDNPFTTFSLFRPLDSSSR
jgi:hypothetical protein